jgi:hypothetical protein
MGGKQLGFSDYKLTTAKNQTKREQFLAGMEAVVYRQALTGPRHPKARKKDAGLTIPTLWRRRTRSQQHGCES